MKHNLTILLFLPFIVASSCRKEPPPPEPDTLPPETQEGKNTFGCLVNGEVWLPEGSYTVAGLFADYQDGTLWLLAKKAIEQEFIRIELNSQIYDTGNYILDEKIYVIYGTKNIGYYTDTVHNGVIKIKNLDTSKRIVAGTFYFDAVSDSGYVVNITNGRFDVQY